MKTICRMSIAAALCLPGALAQYADLSGTVRDTTGAVVPKAAVNVVSKATGTTRTTETNEAGVYAVPSLQPGVYDVDVSARGFKKFQRSDLRLNVGDRAEVDFTLELGATNESVTVTADNPMVNVTETSALGNIRSEKAIKELPLNLRNVTKLFELAPGTVPLATQSTGLPITQARGAALTSVNGLRGEDNNVLIEGINNTENHNGTGVVVYPPIDALLEFKVQTSASDAQYGRAGGAVLNLTMKSGTREFHGDVFEFWRNSAMDAKNFFDPPGKPARFIMNQFGATLGGPLMIPGIYNTDRKSTFFFVDYEGVRRTQSVTTVSTVPPPAFVQGDFSGSASVIYDPLTTVASGASYQRRPFPGNRIPADRIDPVGHNIASLYPSPVLSGTANNFVYNPVRTLATNNGDVKIDHFANEANWFTFRYSQGMTNVFEPSALPPPAVGAGPGFPGYYDQPHHQAMASYTHTFTPALINEFRAGYSRLNLTSRQLNYGDNLAQSLGVPGVNVPGDISTSGGLSSIAIAGYSSLGDAGYLPAIVISNNFQWNDNLSYVRGRHTMKFGTEVQRRQYNVFQATSPRGAISYGSVYTTNPLSPAGTGNGVADLLLGVPQSGNIQSIAGTRGLRRTEWALYLQDTFKVSSRLTLNYGLRYDVLFGWPWTEVANRQAQFLPETGQVYQVGTSQVPQASGTNTDHLNLSPRVGLAYSLTPKTVIRAGYGVFYDAMPLSIDRSLASNPPFVGSINYANNQFDYANSWRASQGFPRPSVFPTLGANLNAVAVNATTPYVQQWNLNVERQIPGQILLTVAYVGSKGTHLLYFPNINLPYPGPGAVASRRPYPDYGNITYFTPSAGSNYHGLQLSAEKRAARGLSFLASYGWAHAIDDVSSLFGSVQDPRNRVSDRGNSDYDLRQRFVFSYNWDLPLGRGRKFLTGAGRAADLLLGGWQMNGIASFYTGFPFTPTSSTNTLNAPGSSQRAAYIGGCDPVLPDSQWTLGRYFNTACFTTPPAFTFGSSGRNILRGPGTKQLDFSLFKNFRWSASEARYVQLRGEFFNIFNTPQFNNPNSSIGSASAGSISSAGSVLTFSRTQRQVQLALKIFF